MTLTRRPSPFGELMTLRQAMDRLFDDTMFRPFTGIAGTEYARLPLDVRTTNDALLVEASLPGVKPEDVEITVENGTLTIKAEDASERQSDGQGYLVREISRGSVMRSVSLPTGLEADRAEATFEHGVLKLRIPKAEQVKPKQIRISPVTSGEAKQVEPGMAGTAAETATGTARAVAGTPATAAGTASRAGTPAASTSPEK
jgi:HSP20 family protein